MQNVIFHVKLLSPTLRQDTVNALKEVLSMTHINILMGILILQKIHRNGKLANNLEEDRQVLFDWSKIKTDFEFVDTFRILNPFSRRFTHQNMESIKNR